MNPALTEQPPQKRRMMLDLETLGLRPGAVVFAIGAVVRGGGKAEAKHYCVIDPNDAEQAGLAVDASTAGWWLRQSPEARAELLRAYADGGPLKETLYNFANWVAEEKVDEVWCMGASFDFPLLARAFCVCGLAAAVPWTYQQERCYRTLAACFPAARPPRLGVAHHALDDAEHQLRGLEAILSRLNLAPAAG